MGRVYKAGDVIRMRAAIRKHLEPTGAMVRSDGGWFSTSPKASEMKAADEMAEARLQTYILANAHPEEVIKLYTPSD